MSETCQLNIVFYSKEVHHEEANKKLIASISAAVLCAVPVMNSLSATGFVNDLDTKAVGNYITSGNTTFTELQFIAADVNNDGAVDLYDAIELSKFYAGTINFFFQIES